MHATQQQMKILAEIHQLLSQTGDVMHDVGF